MQHQFEIQSGIAVDPGTDTPVIPPYDCDNVLVGNGGVAAVNVFLTPGSPHVLAIGAGYERVFGASGRVDVNPGEMRFRKNCIAFYLRPVSGTGPIYLIWS